MPFLQVTRRKLSGIFLSLSSEVQKKLSKLFPFSLEVKQTQGWGQESVFFGVLLWMKPQRHTKSIKAGVSPSSGSKAASRTALWEPDAPGLEERRTGVSLLF